jgi:uncharacterized protein
MLCLATLIWEKKEYKKIPIREQEQFEVLSPAGDITLEDGKPNVRAHVVVGKRDGTAHGPIFWKRMSKGAPSR